MRKAGSLKIGLVWSFIQVSVIPILVIGFLSLNHLTSKITESVEGKNELLARSVTNEISGRLQEAVTILAEISGFVSHFSHNNMVINDVLDDVVERSDHFESIYLIQEHSKIDHVGLSKELQGRRQDYLGLDVSGLTIVQRVMTEQRPVWSGAFLSVLTGKLSLAVAIPFTGSNFNDEVLVANFSIEHLDSIVKDITVGQDITAWVADDNGVIIFHPEAGIAQEKRNMRNIAPVATGLQGTMGTYEYDLEGISYVGSVGLIEETGWVVVISQTMEHAFASVKRIRNLFIIGMAIASVISVMVALVLSGHISRPLVQFGETAHAIAGGEYASSIPTQRFRETEALAASFRHMAATVCEREELIKGLAKSMSGAAGKECFDRITSELCRCFGADGAIVGILDGKGYTKAISMMLDGEWVENFTYILKGSPCEVVTEKGFCFYPRGVREMFPEDKDVQELKLESYLGVPILNKAGKKIGLINAFGRHEMVMPAYAEEVLNIVASRAAVELERQQAEEALMIRNRAIFNARNGIIITDHKGEFENPILFVNPAFEHISGYLSDDLIGRDCRFMQGTDTDQPGLDEVRLAVSEQRDCRVIVRNYRKNGEMFWNELSISPVLDDDDCLRYFIAIISDITEQKRAEQEREELMRDLAAKNEEMESIVYVTSHDLRSPLVNIQGFSGELKINCEELSEMLSEINVKDGKNRISDLVAKEIPETLNFITSSTSKMNMLLNGLLKLCRLGRIELDVKQLDIDELLREVVNNLQYRITELGVEITVGSMPQCVGDKMQIGQVFANLIDNALKYLDPSRQGGINVSGYIDGEMSIYCVEDNGIGISPDYAHKVFEIFHRLDPIDDVQGKGLGLTIVRRVVARHNGKAWIEPGKEHGSKFCISLPTA